MIARALLGFAFFAVHTLVASGCGDGGEPEAVTRRPRGVLNTPATAAPERPPAPPPPPAAPAPRPPRPEPAELPTAAPANEPEPRDYGAELLQALGSPIACLAPRKGSEAPPQLRIDVDAYVMPSGGVGRAYARSPDLDATELDCLRRRVEALRLTTPIEQAPRQVRASIQLTLKPAETQPK